MLRLWRREPPAKQREALRKRTLERALKAEGFTRSQAERAARVALEVLDASH